MPNFQLNTSLVTPSRAANSFAPQVTSESNISAQPTLAAVPAANIGTLTTRTDDDTGVATLMAGHTIVTSGALVDVYWVEGGVYGCRFGMTATKSVNDITLDGGAGDVLPTQDVEVTLCAQQLVEINFDGDDADFVAVVYVNSLDTSARAHIDFQDTGSASIEDIDLVHETANGGIVKGVNAVDIANGDTNVFTGNRITKAYVSHDSASAAKLYIDVGLTTS